MLLLQWKMACALWEERVRAPNLRLFFIFVFRLVFVGQKYFDLFSYPICPAIKGLLQSKEFCCNLKICIPFLNLFCVGGILQSNLLPWIHFTFEVRLIHCHHMQYMHHLHHHHHEDCHREYNHLFITNVNCMPSPSKKGKSLIKSTSPISSSQYDDNHHHNHHHHHQRGNSPLQMPTPLLSNKPICILLNSYSN